MSEVALIIIYNHRYDKNIEPVESLYQNRFKNIYHLIPFYDGDKENVISVYENSHYFQGYIAQGFQQYFKKEYSHYIFAADDIIINPAINEKNYKDYFEISNNTCYFDFHKIYNKDNNEKTFYWPHFQSMYQHMVKINGLEIEDDIPSYEEALQKLHRLGLRMHKLTPFELWGKDFVHCNCELGSKLHDGIVKFEHNSPFKLLIQNFLKYSFRKTAFVKKHYAKILFHKGAFFGIKKSLLDSKELPMPYPFLTGYSDICIVSADAIKKFAHYCGVFSATHLFVEIAIPTACALAAQKINRETKLHPLALWGKEDIDDFKKKYQQSLPALLQDADFWDANLYVHPVKLSQWKTK